MLCLQKQTADKRIKSAPDEPVQAPGRKAPSSKPAQINSKANKAGKDAAAAGMAVKDKGETAPSVGLGKEKKQGSSSSTLPPIVGV